MPGLEKIETLFGSKVVIRPVFQPVFNKCGEIEFHELLLRPMVNGKPMSPFGFVTRIEQAGPELTMELDRYMLGVALDKLAEDQHVHLSVNVSMNSVCRPEWAATVDRILERHTNCARRLGFEITESGRLSDPGQLRHFCAMVHRHGGQVLLDDAGTGVYSSSIERFRGLHANVVKIAKEIVDGFVEADRKMTGAFYALVNEARYLGVPVLAEGIETGSMLMRVRSAGVELFQGYLLERPRPRIARASHPTRLFASYGLHVRPKIHPPLAAAIH